MSKRTQAADATNAQLQSQALMQQLRTLNISSAISADVQARLGALERDVFAGVSAGARGFSVTKVVSEAFDEIEKQVMQRVEQTLVAQSKSMKKDVSAATGSQARGLAESQVRRLAEETLVDGQPLKKWLEKQRRDLAFRVEGLVRVSREELRVGDAGAFKRELSGAFQTVERDSRALVRTTLSAATNALRGAILAQNDDLVDGVEFVATLDSATTVQCAAYSGQRWSASGRKLAGTTLPYAQPPLHWGCRSVLAPFVGGGTRAAAEGSISQKISFSRWLDAQPLADVESVLGKGRAGLFRSGKISLSQLLDRRGNVRSYKELIAALA